MTDDHLHSYPKVYNIGHPALENLFDGEVVVQEKYDGSQFSWAWNAEGGLTARSKGTVQYGGPEGRTEPDGIFADAVEYLLGCDPFPQGYLFRGEVFAKPKHNTIAYDRTPPNGIIVFDVEIGSNNFATEPEWVAEAAANLGLDAARLFSKQDGSTVAFEDLKEYLAYDSTLGGDSGVKVEGVVVKNYRQFGKDGKILAGKYVSEAFKEKHKREWKGANPSQKDIVQALIDSLNTEARWEKAVQHLRDDGLLEGTPKDIGALMKEVKRDTVEEEREWIAGKLLDWALHKVVRGVGRGLPEWYKGRLAESQFEKSA